MQLKCCCCQPLPDTRERFTGTKTIEQLVLNQLPPRAVNLAHPTTPAVPAGWPMGQGKRSAVLRCVYLQPNLNE
jgi:hypothetical protein